MKIMYKNKVFTLARKDLIDIITYIVDNLKAPISTIDLVDELDN